MRQPRHHNGIFVCGLNLPSRSSAGDATARELTMSKAMNQTTAGRIFLGVLILVAPASLYFVNAIAGWAVLALVAGALVARKRDSHSSGCEPGVSSAHDPSAVSNA
jgi:hypothetical protein